MKHLLTFELLDFKATFVHKGNSVPLPIPFEIPVHTQNYTRSQSVV